MMSTDLFRITCGESMPVSEKNPALLLKRDEEGLFLTDGELALRGDFTKMLPRLKENNLRGEMVVKAAKLKNTDHVPYVVDATAGMGEDSLLLAAAGFEVILFEYDPVIAALLQDTIERARKIPEICQAAARMHLYCENSIEALVRIGSESEKVQAGGESGKTQVGGDVFAEYGLPLTGPDVVLLDPMFPERTKSSLVKKKFQLLQQLESPCSEENELLSAALAARPHKILIKRPLKGPFLAGQKPSYSLKGKAVRYDCIVLAQ